MGLHFAIKEVFDTVVSLKGVNLIAEICPCLIAVHDLVEGEPNLLTQIRILLKCEVREGVLIPLVQEFDFSLFQVPHCVSS